MQIIPLNLDSVLLVAAQFETSLLAYMLLLPMRRPFERLPVLVFYGNEQWVADLVEIQPAETMESRKPLFVNGDQRVENRVVSIPSQNALL